MTFTYSPFTADSDRVRFHIGDTDSSRAWFSDAEVTAIITEAGSWQKAVIYCLRNMIARSAIEPDMSADWLTIHPDVTTQGLERLLKLKANELGVSLNVASAIQTYRPDSDQTEEVDYS